MSILEWLRTVRSTAPTDEGDTDTVRRIVHELDQLDPKRARYLAAFAYVLSRVAAADSHISEAETSEMVDRIQQAGNLPVAQATLVVEIAKSQSRLFGGTENFLVTREFRDIASDDERLDLLHCLRPMMPSRVKRTLRSGKSPASSASRTRSSSRSDSTTPTSAPSCAPRTTEATPLNHR